ncbi:MAG TPA: phytoene desaturase, partial [Oceanospirillaceae bacterium]|nr:phytoene desaturase [Oceanospirillaceae bacterium]
FFCMGGTGKLVEELAALMDRHGITIQLNADVDEIMVEHNRATGVCLNSGEQVDADIIVFGGDPETCYQHLLPK